MPAVAHLQPDHDETLIARYAAGDVSGAEAATAARLVADCPACAELHADLRSIIAATVTLPAPRRTRDFRLTEADAARLRRTGWRRLLGRFGDPRLAFARPLATGLVALGIAGLVLSAAPSFLPSIGASSAATSAAVAPGVGGAETTGTAVGGQAGGAPAPGSDSSGKTGDGVNVAASAPPPPLAVTSPAPSAPAVNYGSVSAAPVPAASAAPSAPVFGSGNVGLVAPSAAAPVAAQNPGAGTPTDATLRTAGGPSPVLLASLVLLVLGVTLFALRWMARRTA